MKLKSTFSIRAALLIVVAISLAMPIVANNIQRKRHKKERRQITEYFGTKGFIPKYRHAKSNDVVELTGIGPSVDLELADVYYKSIQKIHLSCYVTRDNLNDLLLFENLHILEIDMSSIQDKEMLDKLKSKESLKVKITDSIFTEDNANCN